MGKTTEDMEKGKEKSRPESMLNDPRFDTLAKREKKVKIDKRYFLNS